MNKTKRKYISYLKDKLIQFYQDGLLEISFHYFSVVVFCFLCWIYLSSSFNSFPKILKELSADEQLYQSHLMFRILFWMGVFLLLIVEAVSLWQKRFKETNSYPMKLLLGGYTMSGVFIIVSSPLYRVLKLNYINNDPFKPIQTPFELLSNLNIERYGFFMIMGIALFGLGFISLLFKEFKVKIGVVRHN